MHAMDDAAIVQHVLTNRSNYYRILFLPKEASPDQVKAAYKKMALKCHPDKNKHPHAADAFKIVGSAHATLSDATKRRIYDVRGADGVQRHESGSAARPRPAARHPHMDFFEEFFARGGTGGRAHVYEADLHVSPNLLMLVPLLLFLFLAVLLQSSLTEFGESPNAYARRGAAGFSLTPEPAQGFSVERTTALHGLRVKYYVTRAWAAMMMQTPSDVRATEREVLQRHRESLARRCEAESLAHRARGKRETPAVCTEYEKFRKAF